MTDNKSASSAAEISASANSAQVAWFSLLGVLSFYTIVILTTSDTDFFSDIKQTQLPVINISIGSTLFYTSAPMLVAALYIYLHFFCLILWHRSQDHDPAPLISALSSSLIGTVALCLRRDAQTKSVHPSQTIAGPLGGFCAGALIWLAAPAILLFSLGASDAAARPADGSGTWLTPDCVTRICLAIVLGYGAISFREALRIRWPSAKPLDRRRNDRWQIAGRVIVGNELALTFVIFICLLHWTFVLWEGWRPPGIKLDRAQLASTPAGWVSAAARREGIRRDWCKEAGTGLDVCAVRPIGRAEWMDLVRKRTDYCAANPDFLPSGTSCATAFQDQDRRFESELSRIRNAELASVPELGMLARDLSGMHASNSRLVHARLERAVLKGATLVEANAEGAILLDANLTSLNGQSASFDRSNMTRAVLSGAVLPSASLEGSSLLGAQLDQAVLRNAGLEFADLSVASPGDPDNWPNRTKPRSLRTTLAYADLTNARLQGANLAGVDLTGAILDGANLSGATGLSQLRLSRAVGDKRTVLPESTTPFFVWNCWVDAPKSASRSFEDNPVREPSIGIPSRRACGDIRREIVASSPAPGAVSSQTDTPPADQAPNLAALHGRIDRSIDALLALVVDRIAAAPAPAPAPVIPAGGARAVDPADIDGFTPAAAAQGPIEIVHFDRGLSRLTGEGKRQAREAAEVILAAGGAARIEGYADRTGAPATNLTLSRHRAEAIAAALHERGVGAERIVVDPKGEDGPVATADGVSEPLNRSGAIYLVAPPTVEASVGAAADAGALRVSSGEWGPLRTRRAP